MADQDSLNSVELMQLLVVANETVLAVRDHLRARGRLNAKSNAEVDLAEDALRVLSQRIMKEAPRGIRAS